MQTIYFSSARNRAIEQLDKPRKGSWISIVSPNEAELERVANDFGLDLDLLKDAIDLYEAPRVEVDEGNVYIFTRYCHPEGQEVATEPMLLVYTPDYLITLSRLDATIIHRLISRPDLVITTQKTKTLMLILAQTNQSYRIQLNAASKQILRFRAELKKSDISQSEFISIIELEEDLNEFLAALQPQETVLSVLTNGRYMKLYEDDRDIIEDLNLDIAELIEFTKSRLGALRSIRQVHDAIATINLNRTFKRLTSIAIFLTIPTIMGGLWGMNVAVPMADFQYAFFVVLGLISVFTLIAIVIFNRKNWL